MVALVGWDYNGSSRYWVFGSVCPAGEDSLPAGLLLQWSHSGFHYCDTGPSIVLAPGELSAAKVAYFEATAFCSLDPLASVTVAVWIALFNAQRFLLSSFFAFFSARTFSAAFRAAVSKMVA
jgi:hypothetical protein